MPQMRKTSSSPCKRCDRYKPLGTFLAILVLVGGPSVSPAAETADAEAALKSFLRQVSRMKAEDAEARQQEFRIIKQGFSEAPANWHRTLQRKRKSLASSALKVAQPSTAAGIAGRLNGQLQPLREAAVAAITRGGYNQGKVDAAVGELRAIWDDPLGRQPELLAKLTVIVDQVAELDGYLAAWPDPKPVEQPAVSLAAIKERLTLQIQVALMPKGSDRVLAANDASLHLDDRERQHLRVLNLYRGMLGRMPMVSDVRLHQAARRHSKDMVVKKFFSHDSPIPGRKSFGDRTGLYGIGSSAENILRGTDDGKRAFMMWYHSEGHHRNMIGNHGAIGAGRYGRTWTQVFSGGGGFLSGKKPVDIQIREALCALGEKGELDKRVALLQQAYGKKLRQTCLDQCEIILAEHPGHELATKMQAALTD